MVLNIVFAGGEHATNLIIASMEVLSHDNRNSHSFSLDGHERRERRTRSVSGASAERGERGTLRASQAEHTAGARARTRTLNDKTFLTIFAMQTDKFGHS